MTGTSTVPPEVTCLMVIVNVDLASLEMFGAPVNWVTRKLPRVVPLALIAVETCGSY